MSPPTEMMCPRDGPWSGAVAYQRKRRTGHAIYDNFPDRRQAKKESSLTLPKPQDSQYFLIFCANSATPLALVYRLPV
jgi:hypothetical protein